MPQVRRLHEGLPPAACNPHARSWLEGFLVAHLIPRIGYCESSCHPVGQVCPTGAIEKLTIAQKVGEMPARPAGAHRLGFFDKGRCLPWATRCRMHRVRRGLPHLAQGHLTSRWRRSLAAMASRKP